MIESLQSTTPLVPNGPAWLTLPFALIAGGVVVALLILWWGATAAGKRRRAERELMKQDAAYHVEDIPTARPITPRPPEPLPEPLAEPAIAEAEAEEPAAFCENPAAPVEGAPAREAEPEPLAEAPNPAAEPIDSTPAGIAAADGQPPVAAEGESAPEPLADEPIAAAAPMEASPASIAADLAEPAEPAHISAEEAPELAADPVPAPMPTPEPEAVHAVADEPVAESIPEPVAEIPAPTPPPPAAPPVSSSADDFTRMKGVGPRLAERLNAVGVTSFAQIAALTPEAAAELDAKLGDFQGRLERDRWIDQAGYLANGDIAGFEGIFGRL